MAKLEKKKRLYECAIKKEKKEREKEKMKKKKEKGKKEDSI